MWPHSIASAYYQHFNGGRRRGVELVHSSLHGDSRQFFRFLPPARTSEKSATSRSSPSIHTVRYRHYRGVNVPPVLSPGSAAASGDSPSRQLHRGTTAAGHLLTAELVSLAHGSCPIRRCCFSEPFTLLLVVQLPLCCDELELALGQPLSGSFPSPTKGIGAALGRAARSVRTLRGRGTWLLEGGDKSRLALFWG
ncbi:hypothetical protein AAHA92_09624 [Salvia divinorum]|uniref:Uncharacterized protein n=1 Tax=Salvia divinorum TaxID=28513 RepID=A0ABD1HUQ4_SALDI